MGERCVHEERVLTDEVVRILRAHNGSRPLFLFWATHYVHMPLQVPQAYLDNFSFIDDKYRRLNHAMISNLDDNVAEVVGVLHETGLWNTTLLVFHADNGTNSRAQFTFIVISCYRHHSCIVQPSAHCILCY